MAGALLARRGWRVLLVEHGGAGAGYEDQGWLLPRAPALVAAPRLWPAAEAALRGLGLLVDVQRALDHSTADLQILLPRARLDLWRDPARRAAELRREWPSDAERLEAALQDLARLFDAANPFLAGLPPLPPSSLRERWSLARRLRTAAAQPEALPLGEARPFAGLETHPLARGLAVAARFLAWLDGELPPLAAVRLQGSLIQGAHRLSGGWDGLAERFRRRLAEARGEILGGEGGPAIAEALDLQGRRVAAVRIAGSDDAYAARVFVLAADGAALRRLLPEAQRDGKAARALERLRVQREVVTVNWVLAPKALPPGLGDTALALPGDGAEDQALLLQVSPARRAPGKGEAPEGSTVLCAAGFLAAGSAADEAALKGWVGRARAGLSDLVPFLDRNLVCESLPLLAAGGRRSPGQVSHPLYGVTPPGPLGVTGLSTRSPWKNAVLAGREVVPGLGAEGEFHAGLRAADAAEHLLGKKARPR